MLCHEYLASGLVFVVIHNKLQHTGCGVVHLHLVELEKWETEEADCLCTYGAAHPFCALLLGLVLLDPGFLNLALSGQGSPGRPKIGGTEGFGQSQGNRTLITGAG